MRIISNEVISYTELEPGRSPKLGRITGNREHMVDSQRVEAHHMRLRTDQIPVAASDMNERTNAEPILEQCGESHVAHPRNGQRIVRHRQGVSTGIAKRFGPFHKPVDAQIFRRIQFHDHRMPLFHQIKQRFGCGRTGRSCLSGSRMTTRARPLFASAAEREASFSVFCGSKSFSASAMALI